MNQIFRVNLLNPSSQLLNYSLSNGILKSNSLSTIANSKFQFSSITSSPKTHLLNNRISLLSSPKSHLSNYYNNNSQSILISNVNTRFKYTNYTTTTNARVNSEEKKQDNNNEDDKDPQPTDGEKAVAKWLFFTCGLVGLMIVVGGVTRLTESGLSITEWKPIVGSVPPLNQQQWEEEFEKYKQFPEYKRLNMGMTLEEFKKIYFWEFTHRLFGRVIGVVFAVPFIYYIRKGYINKQLGMKLSAIFALGGAQGALGWYMVKSGLDEKLIVGDVPRVSQYRLAAHLGSAFVIFGSLYWVGSGLMRPGISKNLAERLRNVSAQLQRQRASIRMWSPIVAGMVFLTAMSGAFVAGLDAGLIYNTFPLMGGQWVPEDIINPKIQPRYLNCFENDVTVQFQHRVLAISTYSSILGLTALVYRGKSGLSPRAVKACKHLAIMATVQVALGISTLLTFVPVSLGAAHQTGSLAVISASLWLLRELKKLPK
ncbi:cytochrome c oxidase assembly protein [Tieghemostelium lacteum]|uniref:Cytochrome c oxidase assembly protein n=1 Tax=Tieghemostelium lacteum TaxID=361077 RepID=A0A151ZCL5_TIELA|nr:cytochrome c oxidase assembly protein [Tieghemostelium lacteum]|eukprot:KYQ91692.1 cytochrome c oxidase assembly protein [Tieghemostelium lacteum]